MCTACVPCACGSQKRVSDSLELQIPSCILNAGNCICVLCKSSLWSHLFSSNSRFSRPSMWMKVHLLRQKSNFVGIKVSCIELEIPTVNLN